MVFIRISVIKTAINTARSTDREHLGNDIPIGIILYIEQIAMLLVGASIDKCVAVSLNILHHGVGIDAIIGINVRIESGIFIR